jgi:hypothetical protein
VIEPVRKRGLLATLAGLPPLDEELAGDVGHLSSRPSAASPPP